MLSDLLIAPSPTCQHGNRKLHRRQLPCNLSPVFRIMKRHPAPAERKHPFRDPLIRLRIPIPDTSLDQPPKDHPQNQTNTNIRSSHRPRINTHPKTFSQASHLHTSKAHTIPASTHIRSSSLKPLICTLPKTFSQATQKSHHNSRYQSTNQANHLFP